jgi:hypothetical protein
MLNQIINKSMDTCQVAPCVRDHLWVTFVREGAGSDG